MGSNLIFTFRRADAARSADVALWVQVSSDLDDWTSHAGYTVGASSATSSPGVMVIEAGPDHTDIVTVTIPKAQDGRKFARLMVTIAP